MGRSRITSGWQLVLCLVMSVAAIGLGIYTMTVSTPRPFLEENYREVTSVKRSWLNNPMLCSLGKHRQLHRFSAINNAGVPVTGYVCYTPIDVLGVAPPAIHEDKVSAPTP